jgi:hypothetical protein
MDKIILAAILVAASFLVADVVEITKPYVITDEILAENIKEINVTRTIEGIILPDSLTTVIQDSLFAFTSADSLLPEAVLLDSLPIQLIEQDSLPMINVKKLLSDIDSVIISTKEPFLPMLIHRENFHLYIPFNGYFEIRKNGFTVLPHRVYDFHVIQNNLPMYHTEYKNGVFWFSDPVYSLRSALTFTDFGVGKNDMNHVFSSFRKGRVMDIENLNMNVEILAQNGIWLGEYEKSQNVNFHLSYDTALGRFRYFFFNVNQEIPGIKLYIPVSGTTEETITDHSFLWENKFVDVGLKHEYSKLGSNKRNLSHLLLSKKIYSGNSYVNPMIEYILEKDNNRYILSADQKAEIRNLKFSNYVRYTTAEDHFFAGSAELDLIKDSGVMIFYHKEDYYKKIGAGFQADAFALTFGKIDNKSFTGIDIKSSFDVRKFHNSVNAHIMFSEIQEVSLKAQTGLDVNNDNMIRFGVNALYASDILFAHIPENVSIDMFLGLSITKYFEIDAVMKNVLDVDSLFGIPTESRRFNFTMKWIFVN